MTAQDDGDDDEVYEDMVPNSVVVGSGDDDRQHEAVSRGEPGVQAAMVRHPSCTPYM